MPTSCGANVSDVTLNDGLGSAVELPVDKLPTDETLPPAVATETVVIVVLLGTVKTSDVSVAADTIAWVPL